MNKKGIIRFWTAVGAVLLLEVALVAAWRWWPRLFHDSSTTEIYDTYALVDGIEASFVKGYRLNDSIRIDLTILHAIDSGGWARLQKDFYVPQLPPEYEALLLENESVDYRLLPKHTHRPPMSLVETDNDLVAVARRDSTVCVVDITTQAQVDALVNWNRRNITTTTRQ